MSTDPTATIPAKFSMSVTEVWTLPFDTSPYLTAGQSPTNVTVTATRVEGGASVTLSDAPTTTGNVIYQILNGPAELASGDLFKVRVQFVVSPTTDKRTMTLLVAVTP
jgi:hypothetical protein